MRQLSLFRVIVTTWFALFISPAFSGKYSPLTDTSTPHASVTSFLNVSDELILYWQQEQLRNPEAERALAQATRTMDLSLVPNRGREVVLMERIILLREVIDRFDASVIKQIPNDSASELWRFPNTDIVLVKIHEGERAGQYVFSAASIQQLPRWFRVMAPVPYAKTDRPDYYAEFISSPGPLFPKNRVEALPQALHELYGPIPLWQWIAITVAYVVCFYSIRLSVLLGRRWNRHWEQKNLKWKVGRLLSLVSCVVILYLTRQVIDQGIWLTGGLYQFFTSFFFIAQFYFVSWLIMAAFNYFAAIYAFNKHGGLHVDSSLITVLARIFGGTTIVIFGIYAIEYMGFSISPLLAGIGVGGLAVALAVRPVLENVINGLTLYADGGIKIGELCRYGDKLGTIESIGLRSTRIRTLERSLITIPNSEFANMEIDNLERRDKRRMEHTLRVRPEMSQAQLKVLIVNIRRVLLQHPKVEQEPIRVRFSGVGEFALLVNTMCYIRCKDNEEFLSIQEDVLFLITQQVEVVGVQLAFSNQYQFAGKLATLNSELIHKAEQTLTDWHDSNNYPFPDFSFEYKYEIKDSIMYPLKTSATQRDSDS